MSISASIDITLSKFNNRRCSASSITKVLMEHGWNLYHNNNINYQPIGSKEIVPWVYESISFESLTKILDTKENLHEINGVMMTWNNTEVGGDFLFWPEGTPRTFSLNLNAFKPMIQLQEWYEIIDFQWYLEKLLPPLNDEFGVEYFSCKQSK